MEFKVVTVGESGVGKTAIIQRYSTGIFTQEEKPTIGSATVVCNIDIDGKNVKLNVWDTAGQEKFNSLLPLYFRNSHAILFVFDIRQNLDDVNQFYHKIEYDIPNNAKLYLIGNKSDLLDENFETNEIEDYAQSNNMKFFKTSAKTGENINRIFTTIASDCLSNAFQQVQEIDYAKEIIGDDETKPKKKCC